MIIGLGVNVIDRPTPARSSARGGLFRGILRVILLGVLLPGALSAVVNARPFIPQDDSTVLAEVTPGTRHAELVARQVAARRLDVALRLAQHYVRQARATGDLRFLGYAEAVLGPWVGSAATSADALVLYATVLQSRHDFPRALNVLEQARALRPDDPQAWLTSATILRVLGRYDQALLACEQVATRADPEVGQLCTQGVRGLTGNLTSAYAAVAEINSREMPGEARAWRDSELGEMAVRLGRDDEAERWFKSGLKSSPDDFYIRAAYADLLLRQGHSQEALTLLKGRETLEPLLLRIAIAQKTLRDPGLRESSARLVAAFAAEAQRGDGVHRREEARFLLDVQNDARAALAAAQENWKVQHESDDVLILIRAAHAAGVPEAAEPARVFVREHGLEDARIAAAIGAPFASAGLARAASVATTGAAARPRAVP
jgi:tetratricopeptide (TPR) repeat protein